ncbi:MAG TPA: MFS transporter [Blastocatellia bacterium]|nr:MFS transporter [Blastocatellia bacterium]
MKLSLTQRVRQFPLLKPFAVNDFRVLWIGQGMSLFGDQFYLVALPWLALSLTGSSLALGSILIVTATTRALFQLFGGALSDRVSPRSLMLISNVVRAVVSCTLTILVLLSIARLWHLYILAAIFGLVDALFFPAYMSIIPMVVVKADLQAGNAVLRGTNRFMGLVGPALAGAVISNISLGAAFSIDTFTFVFAALMLLPMKQGKRVRAQDESDEGAEKKADQKEGLLTSIAEGLRYAWRHKLIRSLLLFISAFEFSYAGIGGVGLPAMAKNRFGAEAGASALGWMLSAFGAGMLIGMLLAGSIKITRRRGKVLIGLIFMIGIGFIMLGFVSEVVWAGLVLALVGIGGGLSSIILMAWIQECTEPRMLGRVMSLFMLGISLLEPLSFAIAGLMADRNLELLFIGGGVISLMTAVASLASHTLRASD